MICYARLMNHFLDRPSVFLIYFNLKMKIYVMTSHKAYFMVKIKFVGRTLPLEIRNQQITCPNYINEFQKRATLIDN